MASIGQIQQNEAEKAPFTENDQGLRGVNPKTTWDILFDMNLSDAARGDAGMAGVAFFNNELWTSRWSSDTLYRFSTTGTLLDKFVIESLSGTRSLTTDGTYLYAGTAGGTIYRIDASTKTLAPPHITSGVSGGSRFVTYDPTLDNNGGGFWTGNFNTDIFAVSMSEAPLDTIPAATHGMTGMYGAAYDGTTPGGPYLWVFYQGGDNQTQLSTWNLSTGAFGEYDRNVYLDIETTYSLASGLAGGVFFSSDFSSGNNTVICLVQGNPSNILVVYDIDEPLSLNELEGAELNAYPIPTNGMLTIDLGAYSNDYGVISLSDINGKQLRSISLVPGAGKYVLNLENELPGLYVLQYNSNGKSLHRKVIVQ